MVADLIERLGIKYMAFTPGATFRGLHDSLVNHGGPEIVECLHEEISVAVAHGYAKATGRIMAVALHDVVGLQHATMAIFNAWCDRVPVLLIGSTGPMDASKRRPWIDWIHTANVQGSQVRDYVKWDDQPASVAAIPESLIRAVQLATTEPAAPVYICIDTEHQEEPVTAGEHDVDLSRFASPARAAVDPSALDEVAHWLIRSERPVVIADLVGRDAAAFSALVELAELLALPVVDPEGEYWKNALNFPTHHPLNLSGAQRELVAEADVVLGLEVRDLFGILSRVDPESSLPARIAPPEARLAHVSLAHQVTRSWSGDFQRLQPVDVHIPAEVGIAVPSLLGRVRELQAEGLIDDAAVEARRRRLEARSAALLRGWRREAQEVGAPGEALPRAHVAQVVGEITEGYDRVLANGHLGNWALRLWSLDQPHQYLGGQGGGGLGYGLGAAVGAALAHRDSDRLVINLQSDGDALFTPGALWTAAHYRLPLLTIMDNNRAYNNSVKHATRVAIARGRPLEQALVGNTIEDPNVDFAMLARSFGVHAEGPVTQASELRGACERALQVVREQRLPALVDVVTQRPRPA
jgi:benzoylformate decarboxylase/acetolactate synthase-1/2/3 large subunit